MALAEHVRPQTFIDKLERDALAPILEPRRGFWITAGVLGVVVLAGIAAYVYQLVAGIGVTGLNDQVFWGIYTVDLVTFIGFSYGGAMVSAILRLTGASWRGPITRLAEGSALVTLLVGSIFPIVHLGHPERAWELFVRPQLNSPLFWDMAAILTYLLATAIFFTLPLIPDLSMLRAREGIGAWRRRLYEWVGSGWQGLPGQRHLLDRSLLIISILIIPLAVMVHTVLSYAFSLTSRPGWHSTLMGPYFVIAAVYSGIAIVVLAAAAFRYWYRLERWIDERSIKYLGYLMAAMGVAYGYFTFTEITTEGYVGEQSAESVLYGLMLRRYAPLFWTFVAIGLVIPVALVAYRRTRTVGGITLAAGLVVVSMHLKRFLIAVPPLIHPLVGGALGSYTPSWVELVITVAAAAAIPLLIMLLFKVVPVLSVDEIAEIEREKTESQDPVVAEGGA